MALMPALRVTHFLSNVYRWLFTGRCNKMDRRVNTVTHANDIFFFETGTCKYLTKTSQAMFYALTWSDIT
jgi:hypothetical protein